MAMGPSINKISQQIDNDINLGKPKPLSQTNQVTRMMGRELIHMPLNKVEASR